MEPDYELLGRKLVSNYPAIAKDLIQHPVLYDMSLVPLIAEHVFNHKILIGKTKTEKKEYLVAIILMLYDPEMLSGFKRRMRTGLRSELNKIIAGCPTVISNIYRKVEILLKVYKDFNSEVERIVDEIRNKFI